MAFQNASSISNSDKNAGRVRAHYLEASVGDSGGNTLCFPHMEEEKYVLRLVRKYFFDCGYVSEDE